MNDIKDMIEIGEFLFNKQITAHVDTLDGAFFNGLIMEFSKTMIVIKDRILGDTPILFSDIKKINRWWGNDKKAR